eukprot:TRINITY_DN31477_c0_g1_i1.p1 TRINITY_DN31477_c0_g1~~TRINITY_DN31477_c0_g1_i1.p1  ORF type:complete len:538 (+),score=82.55 TRINITY_DN31477_c0_g1_i1:152-1765(+)
MATGLLLVSTALLATALAAQEDLPLGEGGRDYAFEAAHTIHRNSFQFYFDGLDRDESHLALQNLIRTHRNEFPNFGWMEIVLPQLEAWASAVTSDSSDLPLLDEEACRWVPEFLHEVYLTFLMTDDTHEMDYANSVYEAGALALARTSCCRRLVEEEFKAKLKSLVLSDEPWRTPANRPDMFWSCTEWPFWGPKRGKVLSGTRGTLWEAVLNQGDYRLYSVSEALTAQYALMPFCLIKTFKYSSEAIFERSRFFDPYADCTRTQLSYAIDHLILAGQPRRAREVFELATSFKVPGKSALITWTSLHATAIGFVPTVAQWPWWQLHPTIKPYVRFLEENLELLASELQGAALVPQYEEDNFPSTSRGLVWRGVDFWVGGGHDETNCKSAPRTCEKLRELGFQSSDEIVTRKQGWSIVSPGQRMGGHSGQHLRINIQMCVHGCSGAELHLSDLVVPYVRGKAIAWQDGWRHEVLNRGDTERWVFMLTVPHPDLEAAWQAGSGFWPLCHEILQSDSAKDSFAYASKAQGPWDREEMPPES